MTAETVTRTAPPTEADIRAAVTARLDADHYGRPDDWLAYFSDGLRGGLWQRDRDERGDVLEEDPELGALADAAEARLAPAVIALAVEEFTAAGLLYAARRPDAPWTAPDGGAEPVGDVSPSRAEIRAAIAERVHKVFEFDDAIYRAIGPIEDSDMALVRAGRNGWRVDFYPPEDHPGTFWADLTEAEGTELREAVGQAIQAVQHAACEQLIEAVTAAAVRFAEAHPDAPRGRYPAREAVPA